MAEMENQVEGEVSGAKDEQRVLPVAHHEATGAGDKTKAPPLLLIVLGEVQSVDQRDLALARIVSGLSSWDTEAAGCDVDEELNAFVKQQGPKGITDATGEMVLEKKSELLEIEVLVNPRFQTLQKKLRSFLVSASSYRFLIYSGLTLQNSGCWLLQDGCFSFSSFAELFHRPDIQVEIAKQSDDAIVDLSVVAETGDWTKAALAKLSSRLKMRLNPPPPVERKTDGVASFSEFISPFLQTPSCDDLLPSTKTVGNFVQGTGATLHIFPGGQGDSALFGVSGFHLLFDGGYARRSCFWEMVRHLQTLDATIVSHLGPDNVFGLTSFLEKKVLTKEHPELGVVYWNETKNPQPTTDNSPNLLISLADKSQAIVESLRQLGTPVLPVLGSVHGQVLHPTNLYHKVGHGSVDLYVLSPLSDSAKETKCIGGGPKSDHPPSSAFLVAWKPTSAKERLVRILFPGTTPQAKIFEGLDRLKSVPLFQNANGVAEKIQGHGKGAEKPAAVGAKPQAAKAKPPTGSRPEAKDVKKPEPKASTEQQKAIAHRAPEQREGKKGSDVKEIKKPTSADVKNGKQPAAPSVKKELPVKATPGPLRTVKKVEGDAGKGAKKAVSKQPAPAAGATALATEATTVGEEKQLEVDERSAMPAPSEADHPVSVLEIAGDGDLSQVQALPDPTAPEEQAAEEAAMQDEEDDERTAEFAASEREHADGDCKLDDDDSLNENDEDSGEMKARGDGQDAAAGESFDPSKEWGVPEGLPAPVNGKEPGAATAKKASQSSSVGGAAANAKKSDTGRNVETKTTTKRPTTAPDRPNNTGREEEEKTAASQSMARGRSSITSSLKDGAGSARVDLKKQKPVVPFYVDVAYIPGHGNLHCFDVDFFRRVRARHYVLSSVIPNVKALDLLVEGKQTWEDASTEVSIIPTYDSEAMLSWIGDNKDQLQKLNLKIGPPAYKCRMQLQELDTSCASYRLEL